MSVCFVNNAFPVLMEKTVNRYDMYAALGKVGVCISHNIGGLLKVVSLNIMGDVCNFCIPVLRQYPSFYRSNSVIGISKI